jgi:hypothetical protein
MGEFGQEFMGGGDFAGVNQRLRRLERVGGLLDGADEPLEKALDLAFRQRADEAVDRPAALEGDDGGDGFDPELLGDLGLLVDVHFHEPRLAAGRRDEAFDHRGELLAGTTPGGPEVDQNDLAHGGLEHVRGEARHRRLDRFRITLHAIRHICHCAPPFRRQSACRMKVR